MRTLLGLDVGITRVKGVAIDTSGHILAAASADLPLLMPRPGWVEADPIDWWNASLEVLARLSTELGGEVAGIGLTGQMHGSVFLDERGQVVRPALLRNDQRTERQCLEIIRRIGAERLIDITGNPAHTMFLAPKILWLRDVEPVQFRHVRQVLPPKDYVRFRLTGELATDVSDASGTLLFDLRRRAWSRQILAALDIPFEWLPRVLESDEISGQVSPPVAQQLALPAGTPVVAGAGDTIAAAIGAGVVDSELIHAKLGSIGVLLAATEEAVVDPSGQLQARCHAIPQRFAVVGLLGSAGASLRWWRNLLGGSLGYEQLATLASSAPPGAEGLFFLPYLAGDAEPPRADGQARGAFAGLRAHHSRAHLTRALMEGVVFGLRDELDAMRRLGIAPHRLRVTGGAARSPFWRQLLADIFNLPVERPSGGDSAACGAALLAGVGARFENVHDAQQRGRLHALANDPDPERAHRYELIYATFRGVRASVHQSSLMSAL